MKKILFLLFITLNIFFWFNLSYANNLICNSADNQKGVYSYDDINCSDYLDYYKNDESNWIVYENFYSDILNKVQYSYNDYSLKIRKPALSNNQPIYFNNFPEHFVNFFIGWNNVLSYLWYQKWLFDFKNKLIIWPNVSYVFPFRPVFTHLKYIPVIVYVNDKQLDSNANLTLNIFASNKDLSDNEWIVNADAEWVLTGVKVKNKTFKVLIINTDEIRNNKANWKIYIYSYATNIYWQKSKIIKTYFNYNRIELKGDVEYGENYITYNNQKWTKNDPATLVLYSTLRPKSIENSNFNMIINNIAAWSYQIGWTVYKYKSNLLVSNLNQWKNTTNFTLKDIYWNTKDFTKDIYLDSEWPVIDSGSIADLDKVIYQNKVYLKPNEYRLNNWFDFNVKVHDEATKTVKLILKTDLWKKIIIDITDGQSITVDKLLTNISKNGMKILEVDAEDILWNVSKANYFYYVQDIPYPVFIYPPKDNLVVSSNIVTFKWFCTNTDKGEVQYYLNDETPSAWIPYTWDWETTKILKKWYNQLKIRCWNEIWQSDYVNRVVIYEPNENIWWRNYMLQMYPNKSNELYINRSSKNADNDTVKIINNNLYKELPWFTNHNK